MQVFNHFLSWVLLPLFTSPFALPTSGAAHTAVQIQSVSNGTSTVVMTKGPDGTHTETINTPYGVKTEVIDDNGKTMSTTTPLTQADMQQMAQQQQQFEQQMDQQMQEMNKLFEQQQKMFDQLWNTQ